MSTRRAFLAAAAASAVASAAEKTELTMLSRRDFGKYALAAIPAASLIAKPNSMINGVILGATTYSFRDMPLDATLKAMVEIGLSYCEFFEGHAQPPKQETETWQQYAQRMREWRKTAPLDEFRRIRAQFNDAGIILWSLTHAPQPDETDEEIARSFEIAATLGVKYMFASSLVSMAKRLEPFAAKYKIPVAMHNHSNLRPDEMARPEDFAEALRGNPHIGINLDIGHFVAAGYDPVGFIEKHHARIYGLHIKDRKKNQGENFPLGEGDTPVKEVLQLLKTRKFAIPALIEYEYRGANTVDEVKRCYEYMKRVVA